MLAILSVCTHVRQSRIAHTGCAFLQMAGRASCIRASGCRARMPVRTALEAALEPGALSFSTFEHMFDSQVDFR
jgi:hypothetical protein